MYSCNRNYHCNFCNCRTYIQSRWCSPFAAYPAGGYTGVASGPHTLTAQNAAGCTSPAANITIAPQPATPTAPTFTQVDPTCTVATGTITVTSATAGFTFSLDAGPFAAYPAGGYTGVASGPHTLTAQNAAGCTSPAANITIAPQPATPTAPTFTQVDPTCTVAQEQLLLLLQLQDLHSVSMVQPSQLTLLVVIQVLLQDLIHSLHKMLQVVLLLLPISLLHHTSYTNCSNIYPG